MTLAATGIPSDEDLRRRTPAPERLARGPVAMLECFQEIPCDPCVRACKRGAIKLDGICGLPTLDEERCNGCGLCIAGCPGLAIFVVQERFDAGRGLVRLAYELLPRPLVGQEVAALDRAGREVCRAQVVEVRDGATQDRTAVVGVAVPSEYLMIIRQIKVG